MMFLKLIGILFYFGLTPGEVSLSLESSGNFETVTQQQVSQFSEGVIALSDSLSTPVSSLDNRIYFSAISDFSSLSNLETIRAGIYLSEAVDIEPSRDISVIIFPFHSFL